MTTVRRQHVWAIPIRTAHDLAIMAAGVAVAMWPLIAAYLVIRTLL